MIRAAGIVKLEGGNQTARVMQDEPITASNRADRQACSRRCPICLAAGRTYRGGVGPSRRLMDNPQLLIGLGDSLPSEINHS